MEVCPSCGRFTNRLSDETGWCAECSGTPGATVYNKLEAYLAANADEIEHYLIKGYSLSGAIDKLHVVNGRPHCLSCGSVMNRAPNNAVFCRKTPTCRRYSRRYVYLYQNKGMSKSEALATVLEELT